MYRNSTTPAIPVLRRSQESTVPHLLSKSRVRAPPALTTVSGLCTRRLKPPLCAASTFFFTFSRIFGSAQIYLWIETYRYPKNAALASNVRPFHTGLPLCDHTNYSNKGSFNSPIGQSDVATMHEDPIEKEFLKEVSKGKAPTWASYSVGHVAFVDQEYQKASEAFQRAVIEDANNTIAYQFLGLTFVAMGNDSRAIECFKRCIELDCANLDVSLQSENPYFHLGLCYEHQDKFEAAKAAYGEEIRVVKHHYEGYRRLGRMLQKRGDFEAARDVFEKAIIDCTNYDSRQLGSIQLKNIEFNLDRAKKHLPYRKYEATETD